MGIGQRIAEDGLHLRSGKRQGGACEKRSQKPWEAKFEEYFVVRKGKPSAACKKVEPCKKHQQGSG